jgi:hypothetical protein
MFSKGIRNPTRKGQVNGYLAFDIVHAVEFSRIGCSRFSPLRAAPQGNFSTLPPVIRRLDHAVQNLKFSEPVSGRSLCGGLSSDETDQEIQVGFCLKKFVPHEAGELSSAAPLG